MDASIDVESLAPGTVLVEKYRVTRLLGVGGMGIVVCAEHLDLHRLVAMKFLRPAIAELPDMAKRFFREALAAARVAGEHVPQVLDVGWWNGDVPYMVMEYLEGEDLHDYCGAHPNLPVEEAIDYIVQAGTALISAHAMGIVHRDIKPANLFRTRRRDGEPLIKVLDFGISKFMGDEIAPITRTAAVMGSYAYMSPEQMRSTKNVDRQTDVYALGVCLYELLTGTQPHVAETPYALAVRLSSEPPDPIHRHRRDVPPSLAQVLEKAYAKSQEHRYPDVETFLGALAPFASEWTRSRIRGLVPMSTPTPSREDNRPSNPVRVVPGFELASTAPADDTSPTTITTRVELPVASPWTARAWAASAVALVSAFLFWVASDNTMVGGAAAPGAPPASGIAPPTVTTETMEPPELPSATVLPPLLVSATASTSHGPPAASTTSATVRVPPQPPTVKKETPKPPVPRRQSSKPKAGSGLCFIGELRTPCL